MWKEQKIEQLVKADLEAWQGDGSDVWTKYVATREDVEKSILPYIATQEPGLSDHGVDHIANVMRNVGSVLGLNGAGLAAVDAPISSVQPVEKLLLLLGALLHDIGNVEGRAGHNQVTADVWRKSGHGSFSQWTPADRRTIIGLCQAHTGKTKAGSVDTLKPLQANQHYFLNENVRLPELAAVLRFADELAEGAQRTSRFLLFQRMYAASNEEFHQYAHSTHVTIDRAHGRVALDYDIELSDPFFGNDENKAENLKRLLELMYKRIIKLEHERVFARHYAPNLLAFSETSVSLSIQLNHEAICTFEPLVLNDFNMRDVSPDKLSDLDSKYDISSIVGLIKRSGV